MPSFKAGLVGYQVLVTPDEVRGRAQSVIGFLATATSPLAPIAAAIRAIPLLRQVTAHQARERLLG